MSYRSMEERNSDIIATAQSIKDDILSSLHVASPGIIKSFNSDLQTAVVQTAIRRRVRHEIGVVHEADPLLLDVPVCFLGGGSHALTFPVQEGDECLVFFADHCIDAWYQSGGVQNQVIPRMHDISDGFALVGFRSKPNALPGFNTEKPNFVGGLLIDGSPASSGSVAWETITGKPTSFPPATHDQPWSSITDKPLVYPPDTHVHGWDSVTDKPVTFPPSLHEHGWAEITGKPLTYPPSEHTQPWSSVTDKPLVFPPETHTHSDYALASHNHDSAYATLGHNHDSNYSGINHNHDALYAALGHGHTDYLPLAGGTITGNLFLEGIIQGGNRRMPIFSSNCNDITEEWVLASSSCSNLPVASVYWYIHTVGYASINQRKQLAFGYSTSYADSIYTRRCYSGTWTAWKQVSA